MEIYKSSRPIHAKALGMSGIENANWINLHTLTPTNVFTYQNAWWWKHFSNNHDEQGHLVTYHSSIVLDVWHHKNIQTSVKQVSQHSVPLPLTFYRLDEVHAEWTRGEDEGAEDVKWHPVPADPVEKATDGRAKTHADADTRLHQAKCDSHFFRKQVDYVSVRGGRKWSSSESRNGPHDETENGKVSRIFGVPQKAEKDVRPAAHPNAADEHELDPDDWKHFSQEGRGHHHDESVDREDEAGKRLSHPFEWRFIWEERGYDGHGEVRGEVDQGKT